MEYQSEMNPAPEGYSTVCTCLMVDSIERQIQFMMHVFRAEVMEELIGPDGTIVHGEARIGDSVVMMGRSGTGRPSTESINYVFTADVDKTYGLAMAQGAASLMEPGEQFYGYREAGFRDLQGNQWWIARKTEDLSREDIQKRMDEFKKKKK